MWPGAGYPVSDPGTECRRATEDGWGSSQTRRPAGQPCSMLRKARHITACVAILINVSVRRRRSVELSANPPQRCDPAALVGITRAVYPCSANLPVAGLVDAVRLGRC
jgi:hypothetical protein